MKPNSESNLKAARTRATIELVFAGALWGFGFVSAVWALRAMEPLSLTGWRFTIATLVGGVAILIWRPLRRGFSHRVVTLTFIPGLLIALMLILQTYGLRYTTATKSGFLTTLYVIIVPIIERFVFKTRFEKSHAVAVVIAMLGTLLICGVFTEGEAGFGAWNIGDLLTIGCAFFAAIHIVWLGRIHAHIDNAFAFNVFQSLWAALPTLALALLLEPLPRPALSDLSLIGLLSLTIGSTLIAFAFQVKAQKILSANVVSLLFLLEAPFATFFGMIFLGESLNQDQWLGAMLILLTSAYVSHQSAKADR